MLSLAFCLGLLTRLFFCLVAFFFLFSLPLLRREIVNVNNYFTMKNRSFVVKFGIFAISYLKFRLKLVFLLWKSLGGSKWIIHVNFQQEVIFFNVLFMGPFSCIVLFAFLVNYVMNTIISNFIFLMVHIKYLYQTQHQIKIKKRINLFPDTVTET